jgi:hypothetical protein
LIYFRLSSLLYLAVCLIAVKDWAKPPSDHADPYHLVIVDMSLQTFYCHSLISLYLNSRDVINIISLCVILILALTVTHGQRSNFTISLPVSRLSFPLLVPRLSPRSFIRKLYKGRVGKFTVYQFLASAAVAIVANPAHL